MRHLRRVTSLVSLKTVYGHQDEFAAAKLPKLIDLKLEIESEHWQANDSFNEMLAKLTSLQSACRPKRLAELECARSGFKLWHCAALCFYQKT